jgi:hypothetical protein
LIGMSHINPYFALTLVVCGGYELLALLGSRERGAGSPPRLRRLRRWLRSWARYTQLRR